MTTDRESHLMGYLAEECHEIAEAANRLGIRALKMQRFGADEVQPGQLHDNAVRLVDELGDLYGIVQLLGEAGLIDLAAIAARKRAKAARFMKYAVDCGTLKDEVLEQGVA